MKRKYLFSGMGLILILVMTGCRGESTVQPEGPLVPPGDESRVAMVSTNETYDLLLGDEVDRGMAADLLQQLPTRTLEKAEFVYLGSSPLAGDTGYCAFVGWLQGSAYHTEFWNLSLAKSAAVPLYAFRTIDEGTGEVFQGSEGVIVELSQGKLVLREDLDKLTMEQFCDALAFVVDVICPVVSLLPPWGSIVCGFLATVENVVC